MQLPVYLVSATYNLVASGAGDDEEATSELTAEPALADIAVVSEAEVGETVRLTVENAAEFEAVYGTGEVDFAIDLQGEFQDAENRATRFGNEGISLVEEADNAYTFEFTIPETVTSVSETYDVEPGASFNFYVAITFGSESDLDDVEYIPSGTQIEIVEDELPGEEEIPGDGDETLGGEDKLPGEGETPDADATPEPELNVEPAEVLLEDFVGDPEEGNGVLHTITGVAPGTELEYSVDTPANIAPFSSSQPAVANDEGEAEFWIHGYEGGNISSYLGDYTTVVTYEDEEDEEQELTASFSVVEAEDDVVTPVVETEDPTDEPEDPADQPEEPVDEAEATETQDAAVEGDEEDTPAVGSSDPQLADTGASGAQLAWIAGGLLAVGGAFVRYANRARLFGRKN